MGEQTPQSAREVKSAFRALEVLELLTRETRPLLFSDFQRSLAYPKASLHALLRTMMAARWIDLDPVSKKYGLGVRVREAGMAYVRMSPLDTLARAIMERIRDVTTETVQLAVLDGTEALCIGKVDYEHALRLDFCVGQRLKAHATGVGKVLLSEMPKAEFEDWLRNSKLERFTPSTITDAHKLAAELKLIRQRGYAIDHEERTMGATCIAVAVRDHLGKCVAAMSVSAPSVRFGARRRKIALAQLNAGAAELAAALSHPSAQTRIAPLQRSMNLPGAES
jgi:IclR family KDG regulon transcriptional repressor